MLYLIILILNFLFIIVYLFSLFFKSFKYIQDINYSFFEYFNFYKWFYIKNYYNLFFIIGMFIDNIYILLFNIVLVIIGLKKIFEYKNIIKFKITKRIIILFIINIIISFIVFIFTNYYIVILLFPLINSIGIVINSFIDYFLNIKYYKKAKNKLNKLNPYVISITGSSGKTSVKNIIYDLIKDDFLSFKTKKSFNTLKGIEISINNISEYYKSCTLVLEMGAKRKNDIKKICDLVKSDISIITNILPQHLSSFKNINNILKEKANVIWSLKDNGCVILNNDDGYLNALINEIKEKRSDLKIFTYSIKDENCDLYAYDIDYYLNYTKFKIKYNGKVYEIESKMIGKHSVYNIMCSLLACIIKGMDMNKLIDKVKYIDYVGNRLEYKKINNLIILNDSYNSNINGFLNAIDILMLYNGRKYLISPGIVETVGNELNEKIALYLYDLDINVCFIDNKNTKIYKSVLKDRCIIYKSFKEAYEKVKSISENEEICVLIENDLTDNYYL